MKLTNHWSRSIYRLWLPLYDRLFDPSFAAPGRRQVMQRLDLQPGERVLLVGVGTGADLSLLPAGVWAVGVDLSPGMLARAAAKLPLAGLDLMLLQKILTEGEALAGASPFSGVRSALDRESVSC